MEAIVGLGIIEAFSYVLLYYTFPDAPRGRGKASPTDRRSALRY